ncbi:GumC family protein [Aurantiacibacter poecillastricola]|uniref:GumC family protein n=1 Tax=Aurantiacibacter poecillastricola TaxID=3064385 RepID=UPI00273FBCF0|nr:polysaccharide biosynthesis tyrosine autokinase [Aurantiacibacter sp. 219JJ12-13]MDP5260701.1 polysaccharide biosynthesis tyrosine autokinase [Aurantiacibacter sp. 219JJ12-13]
MNERSLMPASEPDPKGQWLDRFVSDNALTEARPQQKLIDVSVIRGILFRQRWLIAGVICAALLIGLVLTLLVTPMYEARSSVRIEPYVPAIVEGQDLEGYVPPNQIYNFLSTQSAIITSRSLARTVAENMNLAERDDFFPEDFDESRPSSVSDEQWNAHKLEGATSILQSSVEAEMSPDNWIIEIAYRSDDPAFAAEAANAYADAFATMELESSLESNEYAQEYLTEQIATTRARLQEAEQQANNYARANGIITQPVTGVEDDLTSMTLTGANLADINSRVAAARAQRIEAEQRWRSIENLPAAQLAEAQNNSLLQGLISERTNKRTELDQLRQRLLDGHPEIVGVLQQIETLDSQINSTSANIKAAIRSDYTVARNREEALRAQLSSATGDTLEEQDRRVEYGVLEREAQALQNQLEALLARYNQLSTAGNVQSDTITLLDYATVPEAPYAPSLPQNLGLALVLGIAIAGGLAVLRETMDNRVRSLEGVEDRTGLRLLGHTPYLAGDDMDFESSNKFGPLMEAYASIHATIDFLIPQDNAVIQLTSSQAGEGKSTTSVILAELFAGVGRKTLLIDADFRRPSIPTILDIQKPKAGLLDVLLGRSPLHSAIIKGVHENLDIIPVVEKPANATEVIGSSQFKDFVDQCRREYSLVIIDSAPVLGLADAPLLSRVVDGTIFVMEANKVSFGQIRFALRRLQASGGKPIGGILTKYRALEAGESYNYQYAYYEYGNDGKTA